MNNYVESLKNRAIQLVTDTKSSKTKVEAIVKVITKYIAKVSVVLGCALYLVVKSTVFLLREIWIAFKYVVDDIEMAIKESCEPVESGAKEKGK